MSTRCPVELQRPSVAVSRRKGCQGHCPPGLQDVLMCMEQTLALEMKGLQEGLLWNKLGEKQVLCFI